MRGDTAELTQLQAASHDRNAGNLTEPSTTSSATLLRWKVGGRSVEGRWKASGRLVEGQWKASEKFEVECHAPHALPLVSPAFGAESERLRHVLGIARLDRADARARAGARASAGAVPRQVEGRATDDARVAALGQPAIVCIVVSHPARAFKVAGGAKALNERAAVKAAAHAALG